MQTAQTPKHRPIDVAAILESAGADINAPAGSQAHSLALVNEAFLDLSTEAGRCCGSTGSLTELRAALARAGVPA
jgi:hypothetical protein